MRLRARGRTALVAVYTAIALFALTVPCTGADDQKAAPEKSEATSEQAQPKPAKISVGAKGFVIESGEGDFLLNLRALVQADGRFYLGDEEATSGAGSTGSENGSDDDFLIRRARLELTGTLFRRFDFRLLEDFAPSSPLLLDAWLRFTVSPRLRLQVGKVKLPIGLEREQTREFNLFNEFAYPTALVPNRDVGLNAQGQLAGGALQYFAGVYDGTPDGASVVEDADDGKTAVVRLFYTPMDGALQGLGIGVAGSIGEQEGLPSRYRTIGQQIFFRFQNGVVTDGTVGRFVQQLYYFRGPWGVLAEHVTSAQEMRNATDRNRFSNRAWQVTGTWVLSGEDATFRGVKPARDFDLERNAWGAWQLVARVTELDVDDGVFAAFADPVTSATRARTAGLGLHWVLNQQIRLTLDYNRTELDGGVLEDEDAVIARVQLRY